MKSSCTNPQHRTALLVILTLPSAISNPANAEPGNSPQTAVGSESLATGKTGAAHPAWQRMSEPETCRQDDLNDCNEEFSLNERQMISRVLSGEADPLRAAGSQ